MFAFFNFCCETLDNLLSLSFMILKILLHLASILPQFIIFIGKFDKLSWKSGNLFIFLLDTVLQPRINFLQHLNLHLKSFPINPPILKLLLHSFQSALEFPNNLIPFLDNICNSTSINLWTEMFYTFW